MRHLVLKIALTHLSNFPQILQSCGSETKHSKIALILESKEFSLFDDSENKIKQDINGWGGPVTTPQRKAVILNLTWNVVDLVLLKCRHAKGNSTPYASNNRKN